MRVACHATASHRVDDFSGQRSRGLATIGEEMGIEGVASLTSVAQGAVDQMNHQELALLADADFAIEQMYSVVMSGATIARESGLASPSLTVAPAQAPGELTSDPASSFSNLPNFPEADLESLPPGCPTSVDPDLLFALNLTVEIAKFVYGVSNRVCELTVAGFNASVACTAVDILLSIAEILLSAAEFCVVGVDSILIETTYDRTGYLHTQIKTVENNLDASITAATNQIIASVNETQDKLETRIDLLEEHMDDRFDAVMSELVVVLQRIEELRQANCEIIGLLHTPSGLRNSDLQVCEDHPQFPFSWN
jgi:hypothetical protein